MNLVRSWSTVVAALVILVGGGLLSYGAREARPASSGPALANQAAGDQALHQTPLLFIENVGQFDPRARFQVRGPRATHWLTNDGLWLAVPSQADGATPDQGVNLKLGFAGANPNPRLEPFGRLDTTVGSYLGNDPGRWRSDQSAWSGVRFKALYPGVDLEVSGQTSQPRWRWLTNDGALAATLDQRLTVAGAEMVSRQGGRLTAATAVGPVTLLAPAVAGMVGAGGGGDLATGNTVLAETPGADLTRFATASDINYGTYLGGTAADRGNAITADSQGMIYVVGETASSTFPTTAGAYDTTLNGVGTSDAFVAKINPVANGAASLVYVSFLGGALPDVATGVAVDSQGVIFIVGRTQSADFPTTGTAYDQSFNGQTDVFLVKLNPAVAGPAGLVYATYVGGTSTDLGNGIALDGNGVVALTGETQSGDFPTTVGAYDTSLNGGTDAFVVKLDPAVSGTAGRLYGTYLGGTLGDVGRAIAVDVAGAVYVTGSTQSAVGFPLQNAYQAIFGGLPTDAFLIKLTPTGGGGADLAYGTYLGGSLTDDGYGVVIDSAGQASVAGSTRSTTFPTTGGRYQGYQASDDGFIVTINPLASGGASLVYGTYLGGNNVDVIYGLAIDGDGALYVTGYTQSSNFPTTATAYERVFHGGDVFVVKLNPANGGANDLLYATFLYRGEGFGIAVDAQKAVYVTGRTSDNGFPTSPNGFRRTLNAAADAFVVKLLTTSGATSWYFAEGYTGAGFDEYLTIQNPNAAASAVTITYYFPSGPPETRTLTAAATARTTVTVHDATLGVGRGKSVGAKVVVGNGIGVVVERPIYFLYNGAITGGHNALGAREPQVVWYFAEGYTGTGFDEYLTILNPSTTTANVRVTYYKADGTTKIYDRQIGPTSRGTVTVHDVVEGVGRTDGLAGGVSAKVESTNGVGVVVERSMYFTYNGQTRNITGGHNVMGANAPQANWYFAEGYTGTDFDEYLTIQNPNPTPAPLTVTYYLANGGVVRTFPTAPANARMTVVVHDTAVFGVGRGQAVSARVESTSGLGIIVERPMYFRYSGNRTGGHNVMGASAPRPTWFFAEGYTGTGFDEYLTLLNPNPTPADVTITYFLGNGTIQQKVFTIGASARHTTAVHGTSEGVGPGQAVSAKVETTNPGGIVVERPMYFTYNGTIDGGHIVVGYAP